MIVLLGGSVYWMYVDSTFRVLFLTFNKGSHIKDLQLWGLGYFKDKKLVSLLRYYNTFFSNTSLSIF